MCNIFLQQLGFDGFLIDADDIRFRYPDYADIIKNDDYAFLVMVFSYG